MQGSDSRATFVVPAITLLVIISAGLWLAGTGLGIGPFTCTGFSIDRESWRTDKADQAEMLARCETLDGKTHAEVAKLLGGDDRELRRTWRYHAGVVNDAIGPGDGQVLKVHFDDRGRVVDAETPY